MNTADVLVDYSELKGGDLSTLFLLGRSLWAATWKCTAGINFQLLRSFARRKLYGGVTDPDLSSPAARLVPFAVCVNLKVAPTNQLGGDLVASHMATQRSFGRTDCHLYSVSI